MILRIALVQAYDALLRMFGADSLNLRLDALKRREISGLAAAEVDAINSPVLISIQILQEEYVLIGISPEIAANPAIGIIGHWLCSIRLAHRADPDIEDSINRGEKAHHRAVRTHACGDSVRIAE